MGDSPAFQFYVADYVMGTMALTLAEEGAYIRCLCYQWNTGSIPGDDLPALARVMRCSEKEARKLWDTIAGKFVRHEDSGWRNVRLETERQKQIDYREAKARAGRSGGQAKAKQRHSSATDLPQAEVVAEVVAKPSSSSSSSSSSTDLPQNGKSDTPRERGRIRFVSPASWDRQHGRHVGGFCDWLCLPQAVFDDFVRRLIGAGSSEAEAITQVTTWAKDVRVRWAGKVPGDDIFAFWRHEWASTHGTNRPVLTAAVDPLAGVREAERRG